MVFFLYFVLYQHKFAASCCNNDDKFTEYKETVLDLFCSAKTDGKCFFPAKETHLSRFFVFINLSCYGKKLLYFCFISYFFCCLEMQTVPAYVFVIFFVCSKNYIYSRTVNKIMCIGSSAEGVPLSL